MPSRRASADFGLRPGGRLPADRYAQPLKREDVELPDLLSRHRKLLGDLDPSWPTDIDARTEAHRKEVVNAPNGWHARRLQELETIPADAEAQAAAARAAAAKAAGAKDADAKVQEAKAAALKAAKAKAWRQTREEWGEEVEPLRQEPLHQYDLRAAKDLGDRLADVARVRQELQQTRRVVDKLKAMRALEHHEAQLAEITAELRGQDRDPRVLMQDPDERDRLAKWIAVKQELHVRHVLRNHEQERHRLGLAGDPVEQQPQQESPQQESPTPEPRRARADGRHRRAERSSEQTRNTRRGRDVDTGRGADDDSGMGM